MSVQCWRLQPNPCSLMVWSRAYFRCSRDSSETYPLEYVHAAMFCDGTPFLIPNIELNSPQQHPTEIPSTDAGTPRSHALHPMVGGGVSWRGLLEETVVHLPWRMGLLAPCGNPIILKGGDKCPRWHAGSVEGRQQWGSSPLGEASAVRPAHPPLLCMAPKEPLHLPLTEVLAQHFPSHFLCLSFPVFFFQSREWLEKESRSRSWRQMGVGTPTHQLLWPLQLAAWMCQL